MAEIPIACTLSPEALRTRREGLLASQLRRAGDTIAWQASGEAPSRR